MEFFSMGKIIIEVFQIFNELDDAHFLAKLAAGHSDCDEKGSFEDKLKETGNHVDVICHFCDATFDYWIDNEKIDQLNKQKPIDLILTCPHCKETVNALFKKK